MLHRNSAQSFGRLTALVMTGSDSRLAHPVGGVLAWQAPGTSGSSTGYGWGGPVALVGSELGTEIDRPRTGARAGEQLHLVSLNAGANGSAKRTIARCLRPARAPHRREARALERSETRAEQSFRG